jgi:Ankyrin repeats (3 copies)
MWRSPVSGGTAGASTPLHLAAIGGHAEAARVLRDAGARLERVRINGDTALILAAARGRDAVVVLLLAHGRRSITALALGGCAGTGVPSGAVVDVASATGRTGTLASDAADPAARAVHPVRADRRSFCQVAGRADRGKGCIGCQPLGQRLRRIEALGHDPCLLLQAPAAPASNPGDHLDPAKAVGLRTIRTTMITHRSRA